MADRLPARSTTGLARYLTPIVLLLGLSLAQLSWVQPAFAQAQDIPAAGETPVEGEAASSGQLELLLETLRNEESRNRLIEELEAAVGSVSETPAENAAEAVDEALVGNETMSLGRRIAETTRLIAEDAAGEVALFWQQLAAAPRTFAELGTEEVDLLVQSLRDLMLLIVATYAIFYGLRQLAKRAFRSMGVRASHSGILMKTLILVVSAALDALVVVIAWAAGYALALLLFGDLGTLGLRQTLYLNAFLIVELLKVVLRIVLSPATRDLRPLPVSDRAARSMNGGFTAIIMILGYGQLLLQPIFSQTLSQASGQAASAFFALIAVLIAIVMTLRARSAVAAWLLHAPETAEPRSRQVRFLAGHWHWPVLLYLAFLFVVVVVSPASVLLNVLWGSAKVALALIIGLAISGWLTRAALRGVTLPESINHRLPLLQRRLNAFVPKFLTVLRLLIVLVIAVVIFDTVGLFDLDGWMRSSIGLAATGAVVSVLFILLFAFLVWLAMNSWVDYRLNPDFGRPATTREQTLLSLLRNAATIAILVIASMFALSEIGINIAPLIASAGVLGLAIGFGAQKLVQDIITGVFIQLENAMNVGDVVTVGGITGTVERLTIRSASLRDVQGAYHIIPFSSVDLVTNFVRDFAYHVGDYGIGYREDVEDARAAIAEAFEALRADPDHRASIIGDMEWFGVQTLADSAVIVRVRIKTAPGKQWGVGRALNAQVKRVFDERGIEMPFPHQTVYFGEDKRGNAPAAHILIDQTTRREAGSSASATAEPSERKGRENPDAFPHHDDDQGADEGESR
jgi:small-conductance mechanosensitive channel